MSVRVTEVLPYRAWVERRIKYSGAGLFWAGQAPKSKNSGSGKFWIG